MSALTQLTPTSTDKCPAGGGRADVARHHLVRVVGCSTAQYYTRYLTQAPGEEPGVWAGRQAGALGLSGRVDGAALELLLQGRDPGSGVSLGRLLADRPSR